MKSSTPLSVAVVLLLCACQSTQVGPLTTSPPVLADDEKKLWDSAAHLERRIREVDLVYKDDALEAYLRTVLVRLSSKQLQNTGLELKIYVLRDATRNAFAFPDGVFYINLGLLTALDDESELAAVLAHELAHFTHRHSLKEARTAANKTMVINILGGTTLLTGAMGQIFTEAGSAWALSAVLGYSQQLELEADEIGLATVAEAGYDPHAVVRVLEQIHEEDALQPPPTRKPLATHPEHQVRLEHCQRLLSAKYATGSWETRRAEYLAHIRQPSLDCFREEIELGRLDLAERAAAKYVTDWPERAEGYYERGEVLRRRTKPDARQQAETAYRDAIRHDPNFADAHRELGLLCRHAGRLNEARQEFEIYVTLSPQAVDAVILRRYITELDSEIAQRQP